MWKLPSKISKMKYRTRELAKEKCLQKLPKAFFIDFENYSIIYVGNRMKGMISKDG